MLVSLEIDLALLRTFVAIVDTGSMTSAGRKVGRSQPAISHQVKRLEGFVGRPLFGSDKRNLTLTREGELLLEYGRQMLRLNDDARARFALPDIQGRVKLGTPDLYAAYLLPGVLGSFSQAYPQIEIELQCRRSVHLLAGLQSEEIDIAILTSQPDLVGDQIVRHEPLVWVAAHNSHLETEDILPLAVFPPGSVYRQRALDALGSAGRRWKIVSISDSIAGLQAAVYAGLAVSVLPRCAVSPAMRLLGSAEGMPPLSVIELVLMRKPQGVTEAAEQLANYISAKLATVEAYRSHEGPRVVPRSGD
jgi:DNA-binding transcriptional LysR family regulator